VFTREFARQESHYFAADCFGYEKEAGAAEEKKKRGSKFDPEVQEGRMALLMSGDRRRRPGRKGVAR